MTDSETAKERYCNYIQLYSPYMMVEKQSVNQNKSNNNTNRHAINPGGLDRRLK